MEQFGNVFVYIYFFLFLFFLYKKISGDSTPLIQKRGALKSTPKNLLFLRGLIFLVSHNGDSAGDVED